jgi:hypothetical protein
MKSTGGNSDVSHSSDAKIGPSLVLERCQIWLAKLLDWGNNFTSSRRWVAKTTVLCILFSLFVTGGFGFHYLKIGYVEAYYEKNAHPLEDMTRTYSPGSHQEKLNFRLTVPVVLHALGLRGHFALPALSILGDVAVILLSCILTYQLTGSRLIALFITLEVSSTCAGSFAVIDFYDSVALALATLALLRGIPSYLRAFFVFAAAFTDERGLLATLFVFPLFATFSDKGLREWRKLINRDTVAAAIAMCLYALVRIGLQIFLGMKSSWKGFGPGVFSAHIRHWHIGTFFALEGGWLLVFFAVVSLCLRKQYLRLAIFLFPVLGILMGSFLDGDLTRSTTFEFAAIFVALQILREHETDRTLTYYAVAAFFVSVIAGNYNIYLDQISWFMPVPIDLFHAAFTIFVFWVKHKIGWHDAIG